MTAENISWAQSDPPVPPTTAPFVDLIGDDPCIQSGPDPTQGTGAKYLLPCTMPVECTEDMPCWDCSTMGNQICGTPEVAVTPQLAHTGNTENIQITAVATVLIVIGIILERLAHRNTNQKEA